MRQGAGGRALLCHHPWSGQQHICRRLLVLQPCQRVAAQPSLSYCHHVLLMLTNSANTCSLTTTVPQPHALSPCVYRPCLTLCCCWVLLLGTYCATWVWGYTAGGVSASPELPAQVGRGKGRGTREALGFVDQWIRHSQRKGVTGQNRPHGVLGRGGFWADKLADMPQLLPGSSHPPHLTCISRCGCLVSHPAAVAAGWDITSHLAPNHHTLPAMLSASASPAHMNHC